MELDGVTTCSIEPIHTGSSKVDIFLELFEACDGSVVGHIEYDSSLWERSSVQALSAAFSVSPSSVQPQRFVPTCTCPACMHAVVGAPAVSACRHTTCWADGHSCVPVMGNSQKQKGSNNKTGNVRLHEPCLSLAQDSHKTHRRQPIHCPYSIVKQRHPSTLSCIHFCHTNP